MSMSDVYKFEGKGVMRLQEKIIEGFMHLGLSEEADDMYEYVEDIFYEFEHNGTASLFPKNSQWATIIKISEGVYDQSEAEEDAPGYCIYADQTAIDLFGVTDEEIKGAIVDALTQIIKTDDKLRTIEIASDDIKKLVEDHYTKINVEGYLYQ